jgi:hypothetical protein
MFLVLVFAELEIALFVIFGIFQPIKNASLFLREKKCYGYYWMQNICYLEIS